jgi:prevent-host-death family protein
MTKLITISEFKTHCLEILNQIYNSHETLIITKRTKPIAKVVPAEDESQVSIFGLLKESAKIKSDLIRPIGDKWSAE